MTHLIPFLRIFRLLTILVHILEPTGRPLFPRLYCKSPPLIYFSFMILNYPGSFLINLHPILVIKSLLRSKILLMSNPPWDFSLQTFSHATKLILKCSSILVPKKFYWIFSIASLTLLDILKSETK